MKENFRNRNKEQNKQYLYILSISLFNPIRCIDNKVEKENELLLK